MMRVCECHGGDYGKAAFLDDALREPCCARVLVMRLMARVIGWSGERGCREGERSVLGDGFNRRRNLY